MLTTKSINAGSQLANNATALDKSFRLREGSALDIIVSSTEPADYNALQNGGNYSAEVARMSQPLNVGFDPHTAEMRKISEGVAKRLANNIRFVRTTVNSLVRETIEEATAAKRNIEADSALNINIRHVGALPIFNSPLLERDIEQFRVGNYPTLTIGERLRKDLKTNITHENLLESIQSSNEIHNNSLKALFDTIAANGDNVVYSLFEVNNISIGSAGIFEDPTNVVNFLFLQAALAGKLSTFDLSNITVQERTEIAKAHAYYGNRLGRQLSMMRNIAKSGEFILPISSTKREVTVYDKNYRLWLNADGSSEALIAAVASTNSLASVGGELAGNPGKYEEMYTRLAARLGGERKVAAASRVQAIIEVKILTHINTEMAAEERVEAAKAMREHFKLYKLQTNTNIIDYVKRAVCVSIASGTNAYQLLCDIDTYMSLHENGTIGEAAVWASARLIAQWLKSQIDVVESTGVGFRPQPATL